MICSHNKSQITGTFFNRTLYRCDDCSCVFVDNGTGNDNPRQLYKKYYKNETAARFGLGIEWIIKLFRFFRAFKIFTVLPEAKRILDIGSGRGLMLHYLRKYYHYQRTAGIQISHNAYEFSRYKLGLEIYDKDILELNLEREAFDIVSMFHVLEHVADPERYLEKIYSLLGRGGIFVVEVPNFNSWTRKFTGKYWLGLDLDYHKTFFTPQALSCLLTKYKFSIKEVHTFSLEYSIFISAQSIVSFLLRSDHLLFKFLQEQSFSWKLIPEIGLFIFIFPLCFFVNLLLYFSKRGEVLCVIAKKSEQ